MTVEQTYEESVACPLTSDLTTDIDRSDGKKSKVFRLGVPVGLNSLSGYFRMTGLRKQMGDELLLLRINCVIPANVFQ